MNLTHNRCLNTGIKRTKPFLSYDDGQLLRKEVDAFIDHNIEVWNATVPFAQHFEGPEIHPAYYARHLIETIWRIRLLRVIESKAIAEMAKTSPEAARIWANYEQEEMIHDKLFLGDLSRAGVSCSVAYATEPYLSTKLLAGFFAYLLEHEGPLGVVAYSYLVEYVNVKLDPKKIKGMEKSLGKKQIKGQAAHNKTDNNEDHPGEVWNVVRNLIRNESDIKALFLYVAEHQRILAMYFHELYEDKVLGKKPEEIKSYNKLPIINFKQAACSTLQNTGCIQ